jgi:predicted dehydrogenase
VQIRVAAGIGPKGHWLEDARHGGRVLGELSHFVDLASFLCGGAPGSREAQPAPLGTTALLGFPDGSTAIIVYTTGDSGRLPKERIEAFGGEAAAVLDEFVRLEAWGAVSEKVRARRDKGHHAQLRAFVDAALGRAPLPVGVEEQLAIAEATLDLVGR